LALTMPDQEIEDRGGTDQKFPILKNWGTCAIWILHGDVAEGSRGLEVRAVRDRGRCWAKEWKEGRLSRALSLQQEGGPVEKYSGEPYKAKKKDKESSSKAKRASRIFCSEGRGVLEWTRWEWQQKRGMAIEGV